MTALRDAGSRVESMMVLYDQLYHSPLFGAIPLRDYLPSLIDQILGNFPSSKPVEVRTKIDEIALESSKLLPLGIIINELLTNIMKYAFAGKGDRLIEILAQSNENGITIVIHDNGKGMPDAIDFKNSPGFGLMLVETLSRQLKGKIRIERQQGTWFILELISENSRPAGN